MKKLIAALIFVSTTAFAQMTTMPVMPKLANTVLKIDQVSEKISSIQVNELGKAIVTLRQGLVKVFSLSPSNKEEILNTAKYLSDVELVTEHREFRCLMMENPYTERTVFFFSQQENKLREVLSPVGCTYYESIHPKNEYHTQLISELKFRLISLVNQQLGY